MSLARFARSVVHTRPRQLFERLARIAWQRRHDAAPAVSMVGLGGVAPAVASQAPRAVFAPRVGLVRAEDSALEARLVGQLHDLRGSIDWRARSAPQLEQMNLHYMEYLEALGDGDFERIVGDWIERNPLAERGSWRIAWNSYVVSLRATVWMQQLAARRERLDSKLVARAHASLAEQLRFLERRLERDIGGNHLIKNAKALLWAGRYFEGDEARRWGRRGAGLLAREVEEQILGDGLHYERSAAYHAQVFADLIECREVAGDELRGRIDAKLAPMAQALVDLTHPDGLPSLFNDGGLHMAYSTDECLAAYERAGGVRPAPSDLIALAEAGYYGARNDDTLLLADCGAIAPDHLPAHGHGDLLAFEWTVAGRRVIVDAGVCEYECGPLRDEARSTLSHNTVALDGGDQCEFWAAFRVGRRARARVRRFEPFGRGFVLEGEHDGYRHLAGRPRHVRRFIVGRESLVVDDSVEGGARQTVRARLLLHPDVRVERRDQGFTLRIGSFGVLIESRHTMTVVEAHWCPEFGTRLPTRQIVIHYPPAPSSGRFSMRYVGAAELRAAAPSWPERVRRQVQG